MLMNMVYYSLEDDELAVSSSRTRLGGGGGWRHNSAIIILATLKTLAERRMGETPTSCATISVMGNVHL